MPTTKLRAPESFASLSLEGRAVEVAKDGSLHADHRDIATLRAHGFTDWHDHPGAGGDIETMTKPQLVDAVLTLTRVEAEKRSEDDLRSALRQARGGPVEPDDLPPSEADLAAADAKLKASPAVTEESVATMTRLEMLAFLRARNVGIGPNTKEPGLRAAMLTELRKPA